MFKKVLKRIFIVLFAIAAVLGIMYGVFMYSAANRSIPTSKGVLDELSEEEKLEDFTYMYNIIRDNHPYLETEGRKTGFDWLSHKVEFEEWIKNTNGNVEFYNTIDRILRLIQNGHTNLIPPDRYDDYRQLYTDINNKPWGDVLRNKNVALKYEGWEKIINRKDNVIPCTFQYVEGNYVAVKSIYGSGEMIDKYDVPEYSILEKVNGIDIDDYVKSLLDTKTVTRDFKRDKLIMKSLTLPCSEHESLNLVLRSPDGKVIDKDVYGLEYRYPDTSGNKPDKLYSTALLGDKSTGYLKVSSFNSMYTGKDRRGIHDFLESIKGYENLIIDIRGNGGGDTSYWMGSIAAPLLEKRVTAPFYCVFRGDYIKPFLNARLLRTKPASKLPGGLNYPPEVKTSFDSFSNINYTVRPSNTVGFKGKIYLIVDSYVYSSSEAFAAFAKATGWATIVGTETGGDGIGIDPALFALPNSGLIVRFPIEMGINPDGTANEETHTRPDIFIEPAYEDYIKYNEYKKDRSDLINPYDTVLNKLFDIIKKNSK